MLVAFTVLMATLQVAVPPILATQVPPYSRPPSGVFDVLDFGARGDGTTDDTAALQAAVDAAVAVGGGDVILPGAGHVYVIRANAPTIRAPARVRITGHNVHIRGVGSPLVRMVGITAAYLDSIDDLNASGRDVFTAFSFILATDCSIRDIRFEGEWNGRGRLRYQSPRAKAVGFTGCTRCVAENLDGKGLLGNLINVTPADSRVEGATRSSREVRVRHCRADACLESGFNFMGNTFDCSITDSWATKCGTAGFEGASVGMLVSGNTFKANKAAGMSISGTEVVVTGNLVTENGVEDEMAFGSGILIAYGPMVSTRDVMVTSNIVSRNLGFGLQVYPGVKRLTVASNHFLDNARLGPYPVSLYVVGTKERTITDVRIVGNVMVDTGERDHVFVNAVQTRGLEVVDNSLTSRPSRGYSVIVQEGSEGAIVRANRANRPSVLGPGSGHPMPDMPGTAVGPDGRRSVSVRLTLGSVQPGTCASDVSVSHPGARGGTACLVGLPETAPPGVVASCLVTGADTTVLRVCSIVARPVEVGPAVYRLQLLDP